ncbi:hypothetical protein Vi05172_g13291 [Venturia inaequalis]|nr:hypothetical protein Vi05172_g13291 [Venturia inaequalis]
MFSASADVGSSLHKSRVFAITEISNLLSVTSKLQKYP